MRKYLEQPLGKLYKEIHSKTLQIDQDGILKKCLDNLRDIRWKKTVKMSKKEKKTKSKNKMTGLTLIYQ